MSRYNLLSEVHLELGRSLWRARELWRAWRVLRTKSLRPSAADVFKATWDGLVNLYPKLEQGGLLYVDDYGSFLGCRLAVNRYRRQHNISTPMVPVVEWVYCDSGRIRCQKVEAIWWRKE